MATPLQKPSVPPSSMPLISPSALLQAYLSQSTPVRPSNRSPMQARSIHLNAGSLTHCNGSSLVRVGESTVVCGVRAEILPVKEIAHYRASINVQTAEESEQEKANKYYEAVILNNLLIPNLELGTNCHPSFPPNVAPSILAQSLSQRVLSLLHTSRLVRLTDLEIRYTSELSTDLDPDDPAYVEPEKNVLKAYWTLYIDCVCLSYGGEGNTFDTMLLAVTAALKDVRLPRARWDADKKQVVCDADFAQAKPLQLHGIPSPLSFAVFVNDPRLHHGKDTDISGTSFQKQKLQNSVLLVDPDAFEDDICDEKGTIVVDSTSGRDKILRFERAGSGGFLDFQGMRDIVQQAETRWKIWNGMLDAAIRSAG